MKVTIIGNGISANLGAMYLRRRLPESTKIVVVGPGSRGKLPLVGESLIEISTKFLEEHLGLGGLLMQEPLSQVCPDVLLKAGSQQS